ncbi:MAG: hypothetical protein WCL14_12785 [Bacteroidota bacterium]
MKTIKLAVIGAFLSIFVYSSALSQSLIFCESVDKYGKPNNPSDTFDVDTSGSIITVLVKPGHSLNTSYIQYEIYAFDDTLAIYNNMERQDVHCDWLFCWQRFSFKDEGKYRITAYTDDNVTLGSGELYIKVLK